MFDVPVELVDQDRITPATCVGEVVATAGLVAADLRLARPDGPPSRRRAVGAYIGAAYWFTSSTSFANPAVTVGRVFSDTFAGIAPAPRPVHRRPDRGRRCRLRLFAPSTRRPAGSADDVVVPHATARAAGYALL